MENKWILNAGMYVLRLNASDGTNYNLTDIIVSVSNSSDNGDSGDGIDEGMVLRYLILAFIPSSNPMVIHLLLNQIKYSFFLTFFDENFNLKITFIKS